MSAAAAALVPVFLVILAGLVLRRTLMREEAHWVGLERLAYHVLFPALLIETLAKADLGKVAAVPAGAALLVGIAALTALLLAFRVALTRALRLDGPGFTSLYQGACRWNTFVALSVAGTLYGDVGVTIAAVAAVAMIPPLNLLSTWVLIRFANPASRPDLVATLKLLVTNPFIWSTALGIAINLTGLPVPGILLSFADILGRSALALGLLMVGAGLAPESLARPRPAVLAATMLKLVLMPLVVGAAALLLGVAGPALAATVICAAVPTASGAYVLARQMGGDAPLVAEILTVQTLAALASLPVAIALAEYLAV
jgi:hypothetical protein